MQVRCPYCEMQLAVKDPKPGQFRPECRKCHQRFVLIVPDPRPRTYRLDEFPSKSAPSTASSTGEGTLPESVARRLTTTVQVGSTTETIAAKAEQQAPSSKDGPNATGDWSADSQMQLAPAETIAPGESGIRTPGPDETAVHTPNDVADETLPPTDDPEATTAASGTRSTASSQDTATFSAETTQVDQTLPLEVPEVLGGYRIEKELGRGAMGAVYQACQTSLDRTIALKVIQPQFASDPTFISRFAREAYAAAQLTHHNIVQVYDMGEQDGTHFFSMEFVKGNALDDLLQEKGRLDTETAVAFLLQACRGLKLAHDSGMIHRDIKPANLMLNDQGVIKVADLGLVKLPGQEDESQGSAEGIRKLANAESTFVGGAMGTPAYMAPEQAEDASSVDHRADIYSLGCTLYVMLTGRPPFQGTTAMEVITKHKTEPVVRPEAIIKRVPHGLSEINMRMVAKSPDDRYQTLGHVIGELEDYLGISGEGGAAISGAQSDKLNECCESFRAAKSANLLKRVKQLFWLAMLVLLGVSIVTFSPLAMAAAGTLCVMTPVSYICIRGLTQSDELFTRIRRFVFGSRLTDWLMWCAVGAAVVTVLTVTKTILPCLLASVASVGLGAATYFLLDRRLAVEREPSLAEAESILRKLRQRGVDDDRISQIIVQTGGRNWEEFFEALFGYDAKLQARRQSAAASRGGRQQRHAAWRDPLIERIDAKLEQRRRRREQKHLAKLEEENLVAQGMSAKEAKQQAANSAEVIVDQAVAFKEALASDRTVNRRDMVKGMLAGQRIAGTARKQSFRGRLETLIGYLMQPRLRVIAGLGLLVLFALWLHENELVNAEKVLNSLQSGDVDSVSQMTSEQKMALLEQMQDGRGTKPLEFMPTPLRPFFNSFNVGIAGLILLASTFVTGRWWFVASVAAAGVTLLLGPLYSEVLQPLVPDIGILRGPDMIACGVALGLIVIGFLFPGSLDSRSR